jgi:hypothetical protein
MNSSGTGDGAGIAADAGRAPNGPAVGASENYQRILARAFAIAAGEAALAAKLGVPATAVGGWLHGRAPVPPEVFLRAADIVLTASFSAALSSMPASSSPRQPASH